MISAHLIAAQKSAIWYAELTALRQKPKYSEPTSCSHQTGIRIAFYIPVHIHIPLCAKQQNAATRRNTRREERVTVQGPVKKQQPDGMSHRGGGGATHSALMAHTHPPLGPSGTGRSAKGVRYRPLRPDSRHPTRPPHLRHLLRRPHSQPHPNPRLQRHCQSAGLCSIGSGVGGMLGRLRCETYACDHAVTPPLPSAVLGEIMMRCSLTLRTDAPPLQSPGDGSKRFKRSHPSSRTVLLRCKGDNPDKKRNGARLESLGKASRLGVSGISGKVQM